MTDSPPILMCLTTVATREEARTIARALLDQQHAACVQIDGPIESHYQWKGELCCEEEYRLVIKSSQQSQRLIDAVRSMHPYEQPQIIVFQSDDVAQRYGEWVRECSSS